MQIALGCAMLAAGQIARNGNLRFVAGTFSWSSRDTLWMAPLTFVAIFLLVAGTVWLSGRLHPRLGSPVQVAAVCGALAGFSLMSHFAAIHPYASLLVAAGAGAQLATVIRVDPMRRAHLVGRVGLGLAAICMLAGAGERGWRFLRERRAMDSCRGWRKAGRMSSSSSSTRFAART